jgi:hypothetical protein
LTGTVVQDLELVDHVSGVLGGVLGGRVSKYSRMTESRYTHVHSVLASGLFASVALSKRPEERIGERVLAEVGKDLILDLESSELS